MAFIMANPEKELLSCAGRKSQSFGERRGERNFGTLILNGYANG
jgi:hypothetical protein